MYIERQQDRTNKFESKLDNQEVREEGVFAVRQKIDSLSFQIFIAKFSRGDDMLEIRSSYEELIKSMDEYWVNNQSYVDMLWMISIGVLLEIKEEYFDKIVKWAERNEIRDFLIDFLIKYRKQEWNMFTDLQFERPYKKLQDIIITKECDNTVLELNDYLLREWYRGHNNCSWYETHENKFNVYFGYWSLEAEQLPKF